MLHRDALLQSTRYLVLCVLFVTSEAYAAPYVIEQMDALHYGQPDVHLYDAAVDGSRIVAIVGNAPGAYRMVVWDRPEVGPQFYVQTASVDVSVTDEAGAQNSSRPTIQVSGNLAVVYFESLARFYVYEFDGSQWRLTKTVRTNGNTSRGGSDFKIDSGRIYIGLLNASDGHEVRVYEKNSVGDWINTASMAAGYVVVDSSGTEQWTSTIFDVSENTLVMVNAAENRDTEFTRLPSGAWEFTHQIWLGGANGFGQSVAVGSGLMLFAGNSDPAGRPYVMWFGAHYGDTGDPNYSRSSDSVRISGELVGVGVTKESSLPRRPIIDSILIYRIKADANGPQLLMELSPATRQRVRLLDYRISGRTVLARSDAGDLFVFDALAPVPSGNELAITDAAFEGAIDAGWAPFNGGRWSIADTPNSRVLRQSDWGSATAWRNDLFLYNQSTEADVTITAVDGPDRWAGVAACYLDANNYYYLSLRTSNQLQLRRKRDGTFATLAAAAFPVQLNRTYRLRIEAIGSEIRGYVDGKLILSAIDRAKVLENPSGGNPFEGGHPALLTHGVHADFDNMRVTPNQLQTFFSDSFTTPHAQANGSEHGASWVKVSGSWIDPGTNSYFEQTYTGSGAAYAYIGRETPNQIIQARVSANKFIAGGWIGLMARYVDKNDFYYFRLTGGEVSLRKMLRGHSSELARATTSLTSGTWYSLRLEVVDGLLRGYINGRLMVQAYDWGMYDSIRSGKYGLATFKTAAKFDDFTVQDP